MILVTVEAHFALEDFGQAITEVESIIEVVRIMNGCEGYSFFHNGNTIAIVQKWQNMACFDAYRKSNIFGELITALKPFMNTPPVTTIANVHGV